MFFVKKKQHNYASLQKIEAHAEEVAAQIRDSLEEANALWGVPRLLFHVQEKVTSDLIDEAQARYIMHTRFTMRENLILMITELCYSDGTKIGTHQYYVHITSRGGVRGISSTSNFPAQKKEELETLIEFFNYRILSKVL